MFDVKLDGRERGLWPCPDPKAASAVGPARLRRRTSTRPAGTCFPSASFNRRFRSAAPYAKSDPMTSAITSASACTPVEHDVLAELLGL